METWITSIIVAVAFAYSKYYNTRRTEHPTYGLWNTVLTRRVVPSGVSEMLAGDVGDCIMVSPQYEVYISEAEKKLDPSNTRASIDTLSDKDTRSLFFDFAILLVVPAMRLNDSWSGSITSFFFDQLLKAPWTAPSGRVHRVLQAARVRISETHILATVELKRPPPRRGKINRWMTFLVTLIRAAQAQALKQASFIAGSKRYEGSKKHGIFLIAGAGEWFTLRWLNLESILTEEFNWDELQSLLRRFDADQKKLEALEDEILEANPEASLGPTEAERIRVLKDGERAARCVHRTLPPVRDTNARDQMKRELLELTPPFIDDELEQWHQLDPQSKTLTKTPMFLHQLPAGGASKITTSLLQDWTLPMRLGSPVGNAYMEFVRNQLAVVAETIVPLPPLPRAPSK